MLPQQNAPSQRGNVAEMVGAYLEAYAVLSTAADFSPRNADVTRTLTQLVASASKPYSARETQSILGHPKVRPRIRKMWSYLSRAEAEMEAFFGEKLDKSTVTDFPYLKNYQQLAAAEISQWNRSLHFRSPEGAGAIALPGAGPLPLTAVVMHQQTGRPITCIDSDPGAVRIGSRFLARCGLAKDISYVHADAASHDYRGHSAVLVASLVGDKHGVTRQIMKSKHTREYAVRSAEGTHILLYPPVPSQLPSKHGITFDRRTAPTPEIINTTLFATLPVPPAAAGSLRAAGNAATQNGLSKLPPVRRPALGHPEA